MVDDMVADMVDMVDNKVDDMDMDMIHILTPRIRDSYSVTKNLG